MTFCFRETVQTYCFYLVISTGCLQKTKLITIHMPLLTVVSIIFHFITCPLFFDDLWYSFENVHKAVHIGASMVYQTDCIEKTLYHETDL